ncbi:MAG: hypothetical protein AAB838_01360 [Patescibacteria group bacterium]
MGYYGRLELKLLAQKMRSQGKSYLTIMRKLRLPKSTVSDWCHDVKLTSPQLARLYANKKSGALKGSIIAAKQKQEIRLHETKQLFLLGKKEVGSLSKRDRFIAGIAFYASEGTKSDKGCAFANSNPAIIKFMIDWFKEFSKVSQNKFRGAIWLHEGLNETKAKRYWSKLTGIRLSHFYKSYIAKDKKESKKIRKNLHEYGVFTFYVSDVTIIRRIMGWIDGTVRP